MTTTEKNIKIAKACGWTAKDRGLGEWSIVTPSGEERSHFINQERGHVVYYHSAEHALTQGTPSYFDDMNDVFEMQSSLPINLRPTYQHWIDVLCSTDKDPHCSCWDFISAKACKRAEAFGLTLGLWQPGE